MLQRGIHQVEMNPLEKKIGADHRLSPEMIDHGGIIANPHQSRRILYFDIRRQPVDQSKLPKGRYFGSWFTHKFHFRLSPPLTRHDSVAIQDAGRLPPTAVRHGSGHSWQ